MTDAVAAAFAGLVATLAVMVLLRFRDRLPHAAVSPRGLHGAPVPRVGGLAIWSGFMPVALVLPVPATLSPTLWAVPWLLLFAVSLVDDVKSVSVATRLGVHAIAAAWFATALVHQGNGINQVYMNVYPQLENGEPYTKINDEVQRQMSIVLDKKLRNNDVAN